MGSKRVTLADIASLAGVSVSTVSRVLSFDENLNVHPDTRKKIIETADELSYDYKKSLKEKKKLGFYFGISSSTESEDVFYHDLRLEIEEILKLSGVTFETISYEDTQKTVKDIDGIIALDLSEKADTLTRLENLNKPLIFIDTNPNPDKYSSVQFDLSDSTEKVLNYFLEMGHTKIGFIGGCDPDRKRIDKRENTYRSFMRHHGLLNENYIRVGNFTSEDGYLKSKELLSGENPPTAIFAANDSLVIGCYRAAYEMGFSVPEDISIIGFNDNKSAKYLVPSLTTVRLDMEEMAKISVELIDKVINEDSNIPIKIILPNKLIIRDSVRDIRSEKLN